MIAYLKRKETSINRFGTEHNWNKGENKGLRKCDITYLNKHGKFSWETMSEALAKTKTTKIEEIIKHILCEENIKFEKEYRVYYTKHKCKIYDFYLPEYNLLIEADGDFWHCNPRFFQENLTLVQETNKVNDKFKNELAALIKKNIIRFWEYDIKLKGFKTKFLEEISKYEKI